MSISEKVFSAFVISLANMLLDDLQDCVIKWNRIKDGGVTTNR